MCDTGEVDYTILTGEGMFMLATLLKMVREHQNDDWNCKGGVTFSSGGKACHQTMVKYVR